MDKIAVLVPCYNEALTVKKVVEDFKRALPEATVYVYDNNSTDGTADLAREAGAVVRHEYLQGKGNVIRSMFRDIEAEVYLMADGDDTYPAEEARRLVEPVLSGRADRVVGDRLSSTYYTENKRPFHNFGNRLVQKLVNFLFKAKIRDIMTGYRAFSRPFVKGIPVMSDQFQIETEMTVFALTNRMKIVEIPVTYRDRPEGSRSKLNTFRDGFKVLLTLFDLFKDNRPFLLFGIISMILLALGLLIGIPVVAEFAGTGYVTKLPSAVLAAALVINSFLSFSTGIIMDAVKNTRRLQFTCYMNQMLRELQKNGNDK